VLMISDISWLISAWKAKVSVDMVEMGVVVRVVDWAQGCKAGSYQCFWCEPIKRNNSTAHCVSLTRAVHGSS
jgi:hypothetical protein